MYLYVIAPKNYGHPVKVGVAHDVKSRLSGLQTGNPQRLAIYHQELASSSGHRPTAYRLEAALRSMLAPWAMVGEWFDIPASVAVARIGEMRLASNVIGSGVVAIPSPDPAVARQVDLIHAALLRRTGFSGRFWDADIPNLVYRYGYMRVCEVFKALLGEDRFIKRRSDGRMSRHQFQALLTAAKKALAVREAI